VSLAKMTKPSGLHRVILTTAVLVLILLSSFHSVSAHESCCKHKLRQLQSQEFIVDPTDESLPPDEFQGERRLIPDPSAVKPDDWDDEDDGPWSAGLIENPEFAWKPRMIPNPDYVPPPTYGMKFYAEIMGAMPWVTLGVLMTAALAIIPLPLDTLRDHLSSSNGVLAAIKASFIGLATPLCSCGALPIAAGLVANGVPLSSAVAFLTASQSAGLDSAAITWGLLGPMAALCRLSGAIVLAFVVGMATSQKQAANSSSSNKTIKSPSSVNMAGIFQTLLDTAWEVFPMVFLGLGISTAAVHFLPSLATSYSALKESSNIIIFEPFLVRLGVLLSALPLQLCEHTTVTLAAGIQKAGGSPGLAFAFLLSAPATNLPSLLLLLKTSTSSSAATATNFTRRGWVVARVAMALVGTSLFLSFVVDAVGLDMLVEKEANAAEGGAGMASLPTWYIQITPYITALLMAASLANKILTRNTNDECACPESTTCGSGHNDGKKKNE